MTFWYGFLIGGAIALVFRKEQATPAPLPGTVSQMHQIKPLSAEAIKLGKRPYLGPKRPRVYKNPRG